MNYLGHAFLSFGDADILTGNMIGDHVKGKLALDNYPEGIRKGIMLHRKIDQFTDEHPATQRAKVLFREKYRLYAGAVMDTLFDHFLANDPKQFGSEKKLLDFSLETYSRLEQNSQYFPDRFAQYFPYMKEHNWLYNYRHMQGMKQSLGGLERRAKYMPPSDEAYKTFVGYYYHLNQCYYELIDDVITFVKIELKA
jgi:acyl carrier protein phosphodiesterase